MLAHGLVGGAFARARGDSFGSGFATGVFTKLSAGKLSESIPGKFGGAAASAIIGGTASTLSGGKFANGALSGAFGYLFNQLGNGRGKIVGRDTKGRTFSEAMTIGRKAAKVGRVVNIFGDDLYDRGDQTLIKIFNRWKVEYQDRIVNSPDGPVLATTNYDRQETVFYKSFLDEMVEYSLRAHTVRHEFRHLMIENHNLLQQSRGSWVLHHDSVPIEKDADAWADAFY